MSEFRTFHDGRPRPPTWAERERLQRLRDEGIDDVYVEPGDAPPEFWEAVMMAAEWFLIPSKTSSTFRPTWEAWAQEVIYSTGWQVEGTQ
ncbi:MAG: hypothetical protein ACRDH7_03715 [Actinomycetota bacterium]